MDALLKVGRKINNFKNFSMLHVVFYYCMGDYCNKLVQNKT